MQWLTLSQIKSSDVERRIQAIEALALEPDLKALLALIRTLSDESPRVRVAAAKSLGQSRDERCVQPLLAVLRDANPRVRETAIRALKNIGHASAIPYLIPLLRDRDAAVRVNAAAALQTFNWSAASPDDEVHYCIAAGQFLKAAAVGVAAVEPLLAALSDEASSKRRAVTEALAEINDARALHAIARMTEDPDSGVRIVALGALGRARAEAYSKQVQRQLEHPDKNVRACALESLAKIGHPELFSILTNALRDAHWNVRAVAATALGHSGDERAVEPLLKALAEADPDVRQVVAEALGRLRNSRAIEPLILSQLESDSRVRLAMNGALYRINSDWTRTDEAQRTLAPLKRALKDKDCGIRHTAAELLNQIFNIRQCDPSLVADVNAETARRQRAVDVLASVLWDDDPLVRFVSVWTLHQIGDARAMNPLSAKLKDDDEFVRAAAEEALAFFGLRRADEAGTGATDGPRLVESQDNWGTGAIV